MIWKKSEFPGVRFYEHDDRRHGVKKDRNYYIRYKCQGKTYEEPVGWSSQGNTARSVYDLLAELKRNQKAGIPPFTLAEKREQAEAEQIMTKEARRLERIEQERMQITLLQFFEADYLPSVEGSCSPETVRKAREHVKNWLAPALENTPLPTIASTHLEKVRQALLKSGKSARTMQYVFATFRAIWNLALERGIVSGRNPVKGVKLPVVDNMRQRYLKSHEADALIEALNKRSPVTRHMALISLHTGMRFKEIAELTWGAVDLDRRQVNIIRTKGKKARTVHMTEEILRLLSSLQKGHDGDLIFPSNTGERIGKVSKTFDQVVNELGLNEGITDPKARFTFHCLRHTHASWLIENGVQLYLVQKQLGHSTPVVTQRYAHVSDQQLAEATLAFERGLERKQAGKVIPLRTAVNQ